MMEYENYTFGEALKHLADRAGVELPKIEYSREAKESGDKSDTSGNQQSWQHSIIISA